MRDDRTVFADLDLSLDAGEIVQLIGANGSGKTTLLRTLAGLVPLEAGAVYWNGLEIGEADSTYRAVVRYLGHLPGVKHDLTPWENLTLERALGVSTPGEPIASALGRLGLLGCEHSPLRRLSAGQCRRVGLARLLVAPAPLWLLDEPFTALDAPGRGLVERLLFEHVRAGGLAVVATHMPIDAAAGPVRNLRLSN
jgi:heme exporter protein A